VERVPDDYAPSAEEALTEARRLLGESRPFHAHEVLEGRWKTAPEAERELWQGLAQICVGLTHLQRGNRRGAAALFARGAGRISRYGPPYEEIALTARELGGAGDPDPGAAITAIRDLL
jgi:predicted metal-dependent hydrolase